MKKTVRPISFRNKLLLALVVVAGVVLLIPTPKTRAPLSTVVLSSEGHLLGARIAGDGQWRFPPPDTLPEKFCTALITFEDRWFYYHPGINPVSLVRALIRNLKYGKVISGGSTLSMQVARLARNNPPRTYGGKLLEMMMALKLELVRSKRAILRQYATTAPFGGNVVGLEAASWRYFGRPSSELSWAEAAALAVLPNSPALVHPGRNRTLFKDKRDRLLDRLYARRIIDSTTYILALREPIPLEPEALPNLAPHLTDRIVHEQFGQQVTTTLSYNLQKKVTGLTSLQSRILAQNGIHNMAAMVVEVETGYILAYTGNVPDQDNRYGNQVDIIQAPRSSGSILKPFLYAAMLHHGELLPHALVPDLPVNFSGYAPKNFDASFSGAVPASQALSRSLNVPAVELLYRFGEARFLDQLRSLGFTTFNHDAGHYGLSLILGGGETTLIELAGAYASLARVVDHFGTYRGYRNSDFFRPMYYPSHAENKSWNDQPVLSAASVWCTFQSMQEVNRPEERSGWRFFSSSGQVAWKTGTSFGYRDGWAVAVTPQHVVAVWAGNANGEGRPGLTGTAAAAPLLFDILDLLPTTRWFNKPLEELTSTKICSESGYKASPYCPHQLSQDIPASGEKTLSCPYHRLVHLSADRCWQVNASCYPLSRMVTDSLFILPPAMEWFYRPLHPSYRTLPPFLPGCESDGQNSPIDLLYPLPLQKIFVPRELDGSPGKAVFEAVHRSEHKNLFWYLDDQFIGQTSLFHQVAVFPAYGEHVLTVVDSDGNQLKRRFFITSNLFQ